MLPNSQSKWVKRFARSTQQPFPFKPLRPHTVNSTVKPRWVWLHSLHNLPYNVEKRDPRNNKRLIRLPRALYFFRLSHVRLSLPLCHPVLASASLPNPASNYPNSLSGTLSLKVESYPKEIGLATETSSNAIFVFRQLGHPRLLIASCFGC